MFKVFIPFRQFQNGIGGPRTFMRNLKDRLDTIGFSYQNKAWFSSAIFFPISVNFRLIKIVKFFRGKVIQRLDGVYYPSKHAEKYLDNNYNMKYIYQNFADYVVFQSEYSKKQVFNMFGPFSGEYSIIFNGADLAVFYPATRTEFRDKIIISTTGNFRNDDMIIPVILALDCLSKKYNIEFHIIGPLLIDEKESVLARNYVRNFIYDDSCKIADHLRNSDVFVYSHLNPPCPNSVIEAVCCGLPVVGFDSGAMSEICFFNKDLLAYVSDDLFQEYKDFDYKSLETKFHLLLNNFHEFKSNALNYCDYYSMDKCARSYIEAFSNAQNKRYNGLL